MTSETDVSQTDAIEVASPVKSDRRGGAVRVIMIVAAAVVGLAVLAGGVLAVADRGFAGSGKIARNVTIQGVVVEGMTASEASDAVSSQWASTLPEEITVTFPGDSEDAPGEWVAAPEDIGVTLAGRSAQARPRRRSGHAFARAPAHDARRGGRARAPACR